MMLRGVKAKTTNAAQSHLRPAIARKGAGHKVVVVAAGGWVAGPGRQRVPCMKEGGARTNYYITQYGKLQHRHVLHACSDIMKAYLPYPRSWSSWPWPALPRPPPASVERHGSGDIVSTCRMRTETAALRNTHTRLGAFCDLAGRAAKIWGD
jgi:hypothetical protein